MALYPLINEVQHYDWGSTTLIPSITGKPNPEGLPMAEIWMGAHPRAPSRILTPTAEVLLPAAIEGERIRFLGPDVTRRFGSLPFLYKIIAAGAPLSIQAHPAKTQAEAGFARENAADIPLDAPDRNYRDRNHKPEIICALTPFTALKGFRSSEEIIALAQEFGVDEYTRIARGAAEGLRPFFSELMSLPDSTGLAARLVAAAAAREDEPFSLIRRLNEYHPGDLGVAAPLYLNLIQLKPGQALFLTAGELHAYLDGAGVELMAASDNVLRGGLTHKHVDVAELLSVLNFESSPVSVLTPRIETGGACEEIYRTPAGEFRLSRIRLSAGERCLIAGRGPRILLAVAGGVRAGGEYRLAPGDSLFLTADEESTTIESSDEGAELYLAGVPL